ncbi:MAG: hypothetical protein M0Q53_08420 [Prolixibacteraceae bacterium]|nr:hypothetical protein [Prolixibacteraceae bacterium]
MLIIALTDMYPVQPLSDHRFVVGMVFLGIGGFTRQAFKKYREQIEIK